MVTVAGIVTDVRPRPLNAPAPISLKPLAGKMTPVNPRLTCVGPLPSVKAEAATPTTPCGIVAVPLQVSPALARMVSPATQKLPLVLHATKYEVLTAELVK